MQSIQTGNGRLSQDEVQGLRCNSAAGCDSIRPKKRASNALTLSGKVTACRGERQTFQRSASQNWPSPSNPRPNDRAMRAMRANQPMMYQRIRKEQTQINNQVTSKWYQDLANPTALATLSPTKIKSSAGLNGSTLIRRSSHQLFFPSLSCFHLGS